MIAGNEMHEMHASWCSAIFDCSAVSTSRREPSEDEIVFTLNSTWLNSEPLSCM